ncbi:MAG: hypothetical protein GDA36_04805 [Rhodobacteraceae bacterium]|nr:hypothetical protein [Paracoccaceae bacterium]
MQSLSMWRLKRTWPPVTCRRSSRTAGTGLTQKDLIALFDAQVMSRHLDRVSRKLQARG